MSRIVDVAVGGALRVLVRKRRLRCENASCDRATFTQTTGEVGLRARLTTRLAARVVGELAREARSVSAVAEGAGLSWPTVMRLVASTVTAGHDPDRVRVARLGVDEHRFRTVRFVRLADGPTVRIDPWSVVFTDLDTGAGTCQMFCVRGEASS